VPDRLAPNEVYAGDIGREHVGKTVSADGVTGILRDLWHIDSVATQLLIGHEIVTLATGRPVAVAPD
jgi:hypothetical protein